MSCNRIADKSAKRNRKATGCTNKFVSHPRPSIPPAKMLKNQGCYITWQRVNLSHYLHYTKHQNNPNRHRKRKIKTRKTFFTEKALPYLASHYGKNKTATKIANFIQINTGIQKTLTY